MPTSTSKDLGLAAAIIPSATAPSNTLILWLDTSQSPAIKKYYDPTTSQWLPLINEDNNSGDNSIKIDLGSQILFVSANGNDFKAKQGDLSKCFNTIGGAYAFAKTLLPTIINKIVIAVYPGSYLENVIMDSDYINIVSAVPQNLIYNEDLINGFTFDNIKRKYIVEGTITLNCKNASIKGLDVKNLILNPYITDGIDIKPVLRIENMICQTISNPISIGEVTGNFYDVHAENFLNSDTQTNLSGTFIRCGGNKAFRSGIATLTGNVWRGGVLNAYFESCYGGDGSLCGLGGYISSSTILNCSFKNNCISTIENCDLKVVSLGNTCIKSAINTTFTLINGGSDCMRDFTGITISNSLFGVDFGKNGTLTFVSGELDNVKSDYSDGFAYGRQFWGKMRKMLIKCINPNNSSLNLCTPSDSGVDRQPSIIEHCTILHCVSTGTKSPIDGTIGYLSYCKFNKAYTVANVLGSDVDSNNIINTNLCTYVAVTCALPTLFSLVTPNFSTGAPINFTFNYQMSVSRAGSNIEMTDPNGVVSVVNFVGNNGGSASGTLTINVASPVAGAYSFRLRTICGYDGSGNVAFASSYTTPITANVTNSVRATAWRASTPTLYCIVNTLSQNPLYGKLSLESSAVNTTYFPNESSPISKAQTTTSKIRLTFYSDAGLTVPVSLVNQNFSVFIKAVNKITTDSSGAIQITEGITVYSFSNISGNSVLLNSGADFNTQVLSSNYVNGTPVEISDSELSYFMFPSALMTNNNTGYKEWTTLEQYYTDNSTPTGVTKANVSSDPDYIAPVSDNTICPTDPPTTTVQFGIQLYGWTINLVTGGTTLSPAIPTPLPYNSYNGGDVFVVQRFKGQPTTLTARVDSYYSGGVTTPGKIQVLVEHDGGTVSKFQINKNILTTIGTFIDITSINFSNF